MRKKILALDQGEHIGGAEIFFSELLEHLAEFFDIHLITSSNPIYQKRYRRVTLHPVELPSLRPWKFFSYLAIQERIRILLDQLRPDVIISNTVRTHVLVSKLAKEKKIPLLWMAHDFTFPKILLRYCIQFPKVILCCSKAVISYYRSVSSRPQYECFYPFALESAKAFPSTKKKIIGMLGKAIPWKGQDLFISVAKKLSALFPEYEWKLISSPYEGNASSKRYYESCIALAKNIPSFRSIDSVPNVFEELSSWDVFVHCSKEPEPLGRVILEAISCGCAVIASNLGGPKEIIEHDRTGLLIDPEEQALEQSLRKLLSDPPTMQRLQRNALEYCNSSFSWKELVSRFQSIINSIR